MAKKKGNVQPMTLRQRLRADADKKLDNLVERATEAVDKILEDTPLIAADLMHLASSKQNKTLRSHMVGVLANSAEEELEKLYNSQMKLIPDEEVSA